MGCSSKYAACVSKCKPPTQSAGGGVGENDPDDGWSQYAECMAKCIAAWSRCVDGKVPKVTKRLKAAKTNRGRRSALEELREMDTLPRSVVQNINTALRRLKKV